MAVDGDQENVQREITGSSDERQASKEIKELQKGVYQKVSYWQQKASEKGNSKQELLLEKILEKLESIDAGLTKIEQARKD